MTTWRGYKARVPLRGEAARAYEAARDEMGIGYLILKARASAGMTQRELANRIGSSQPAVARWESGASYRASGASRRSPRRPGSNSPSDCVAVTRPDERS